MWIFFVGGFVSVVASDRPGFVAVRGRAREHVIAFLDHEPPGAPTRHVVETPDRDYRFRAIVPVAAFAACLDAIAYEVPEVDNFKGACADAGAPRAWLGVLGKVWGLLYSFQALTGR